MTALSSYTHFVADQVLTAEHLNGLFNYLDEQNRHTRNKLLGIGIVCGLEYETPVSSIKVSKGTGITSAGYLVLADEGIYTHYRPVPYVLPDDFIEIEADYGFPYSKWKDHMYELVPNTDSTVKGGDLSIASNLSFLNDKVLVYLLEKKTTDLKNCTTNDCDDKGERVDFTVKPLLVDKSAIDETGYLTSNNARIFPEVDLKRIVLPDNADANDIVEAFKTVYLSNDTLQQLETGLGTVYNNFTPLFPAPSAINPFTGIAAAFTNRVNSELSNNVFSVQYFYDWLDDLIKAYHELTHYASEIISECCPSETSFPMHLLLGEANRSSVSTAQSYRSYFIYSSLFQPNDSGRLHLQSLIQRIVKLYNNFETFTLGEMRTQEIEITPSTWGKAMLSERCIPFYYDINEVLKPWNYKLTRLGKEKRNLSYNAQVYATDDAVLNPLEYDIEKNDFYRIEGHIGKRINNAYKEITTLRDDFNLPFDLVALNLNKSKLNLKNISEDDIQCAFKDLESAYRVYISGFLEDIHKTVCFITHLPLFEIKTNNSFFNSMMGGVSSSSASGTTVNEQNEAFKKFGESVMGGCFTHSNSQNYSQYIDQKYEDGYTRGDYVKEIFTPIAATVGKKYLEMATAGTAIPAPQFPTGTDISALLVAFYSRAFYFLELTDKVVDQLCAEAELLVLNETTLYQKIHEFEKLCHRLKQELLMVMGLLSAITKEPAAEKNNYLPEFILDLEFDLFADELELLLDMGFEERVQSLMNELKKRKKQVAYQFTLGGYNAAHPGLEHKSGVPRGGTFVLLYSYMPKEQKDPSNPKDDNEEPDDTDFPCDDTKPNRHRSKRMAHNRYSHGTGSAERTKGKITREEYENMRERHEKQGAVIADFYLPYLCCGGCGSPVVVEKKPVKEQTEIVYLKRSTEWKDTISIADLVKKETAEADYANIATVINPDSLNIQAGKIVNAPNSNASYMIKYKALVNGKLVGVILFLEITAVTKKRRKEELTITQCLDKGQVNLKDPLQKAGYEKITEVKSNGGLTIDEDTYEVSTYQSADKEYSLRLIVVATDGEEVELQLTLMLYKPDASFDMRVRTSAVTNGFFIQVAASDPGLMHTKKVHVMVTDGTKQVEISESQDWLEIDKTDDLHLKISVSMRGLKQVAEERKMDAEAIGIQIVTEDTVNQLKDACKAILKSDLVNRKFLEKYDHELSAQNGKLFQYK